MVAAKLHGSWKSSREHKKKIGLLGREGRAMATRVPEVQKSLIMGSIRIISGNNCCRSGLVSQVDSWT